ncbi:hypothetical protein [Terrabacter sp. NPDC000476]|uniref:hypothetical protein n=1 Tax=Terrabacter sp. NPDC000476 TaxID=3154258 RepID=UPI003322BC25
MSEDTASGADLGTITGWPLAAAIEALLASLEPVRVTRHHRRPSRRPLRQQSQWPGSDPLSQRLGLTVPTLSALRERGQLEVFGPHPDEVRPVHELAAGESATVSVAYVPHESVLDLPVEQALETGATCLGVRYGHGHPWPPPVATPRTRRDPASGDFTVIDVHGQLVGVQHLWWSRTRMTWAVWSGADGGVDGGYDVEVLTGLTPLAAVRLLVSCDLFNPSGDEP